MAEKEPTQFTPKGAEIPIPTRDQVGDDFARIVAPLPAKPKKRHRKKA